MPANAIQLQQQNYSSFTEFEKNFELQGERLYSILFDRNKENIKVSKEKFAVRNLQKIFNATFLISHKIGFEAMSLRDLSAETGLSMGGLYSTIASKDAIAIMVQDVVAIACAEIVENSKAQESSLEALQTLVKGYLFSSTLLQSWFHFLYFETKSLPVAKQEVSKNLDLGQVEVLAGILRQLKPESTLNMEFVSTMAVSLIQERYVKPWKHHQAKSNVDQYADDCLGLIYTTIDYQL